MSKVLNLDIPKMEACALRIRQNAMKRNEILSKIAGRFNGLDYEGEVKDEVKKNLGALEKTSNAALAETKSLIEYLGENGANVGDILKGLHQADVVKAKAIEAKKRAKGLTTKGLG